MESCTVSALLSKQQKTIRLFRQMLIRVDSQRPSSTLPGRAKRRTHGKGQVELLRKASRSCVLDLRS
jgi:hypothetical protein